MFRRQIAARKICRFNYVYVLDLLKTMQNILRNKSIRFIFMDSSNAKCQDEDFFIGGAIEMHINLMLDDPQLFML